MDFSSDDYDATLIPVILLLNVLSTTYFSRIVRQYQNMYKHIPNTKTIFKRDMECFDRYTKRCLPEAKVLHFQNIVAGARIFISKFCSGQKFESGYIRHKECFYHIQDDWKRCTENFHDILWEEVNEHNLSNITNKYMQFCCARHAYETCIYKSVRLKCFNDSEPFKKDPPDGKLFTNCRRYECFLCSVSPKIPETQHLTLLLTSWIIALNWRRNIV